MGAAQPVCRPLQIVTNSFYAWANGCPNAVNGLRKLPCFVVLLGFP